MMREKGESSAKNDEIAELKFYIPEDMSATIETEGIVKLLLNQFKDANLLEAIDGIQRYRNVVELTVLAEYRQKFLKTPITWCRCSSYLVTENEPIIIINIYAARLTSRWTDLVNKFNEFGKVVIYYDLKENYNGHEVKTGVRSIWLKDVIKRPKELTQGNRKLRVVYDKDIMNKLLSIGELAHEAKGGVPQDSSDPTNNVVKDELEAKFADLLKSSNLHHEDGKDSWEQPGPSGSGGDGYGIFSDLKGQLETIVDTEEPPETPDHRRMPASSDRGKGPAKQSKEAIIQQQHMQQIQQPHHQHQQQQQRQQRPSQLQPPPQQQQQVHPSAWRNETPM